MFQTLKKGFISKNHHKTSENRKHKLCSLINSLASVFYQDLVKITRGLLEIFVQLDPDPRDDLESLGYILAYYMKKGNLFKPNPQKTNRKTYYLQEKLSLVPEVFLGPSSPVEFIDYFNYVRYLDLKVPINYSYLESLFMNILNKMKNGDLKYDWVLKMEQEKGLEKVIKLANLCTGNMVLNKPLKQELFDIKDEVLEEFKEDYGEMDEGETLELNLRANNWVLKGLIGLKEGQKDGKGFMKTKRKASSSEGKAFDSDSTSQG